MDQRSGFARGSGSGTVILDSGEVDLGSDRYAKFGSSLLFGFVFRFGYCGARISPPEDRQHTIDVDHEQAVVVF